MFLMPLLGLLPPQKPMYFLLSLVKPSNVPISALVSLKSKSILFSSFFVASMIPLKTSFLSWDEDGILTFTEDVAVLTHAVSSTPSKPSFPSTYILFRTMSSLVTGNVTTVPRSTLRGLFFCNSAPPFVLLIANFRSLNVVVPARGIIIGIIVGLLGSVLIFRGLRIFKLKLLTS